MPRAGIAVVDGIGPSPAKSEPWEPREGCSGARTHGGHIPAAPGGARGRPAPPPPQPGRTPAPPGRGATSGLRALGESSARPPGLEPRVRLQLQPSGRGGVEWAETSRSQPGRLLVLGSSRGWTAPSARSPAPGFLGGPRAPAGVPRVPGPWRAAAHSQTSALLLDGHGQGVPQS